MPDHLAQSVQRLAFVHKIDAAEDMLRIYVDEGAQHLPDLIDAARKQGAEIRSVSVHEQSLEDMFIHFTGKSIREEEAKKVSMLIGAGIPQKFGR